MNFDNPEFCMQAVDYLLSLKDDQFVPDLLFPGGKGTEDMARQAQKKGLKVYDWRSGS